MTRDLGVWKAEDCALVLIDYQREMFEVIRSETDADMVELHARLLAKTAKAFDMPIVLSTVGVNLGFNGPTLPSILDGLDGVEPIDRTSMNSWEDKGFRDAIKATGRKKIVIAGLWTEVCVTFPTIQMLNEGFEIYVPTDACGDITEEAHERAVQRIVQAGAVPMNSLQFMCELQRDWARGETYEGCM